MLKWKGFDDMNVLIAAGIVATVILLFGMFWYFENTASGKEH